MQSTVDPNTEPLDECVEELLHLARSGDRVAQQRLYSICLPMMRRWARGVLPRSHHGINDPDDLVQIALMHAWRRLADFEVRGAARFYAYLYRVLRNEVRGELRRCRGHGTNIPCDDSLSEGGDPAMECLIAWERERTFAQAVRQLDDHQRRHFDMRIGLGMSFGEIAAHTGGSADGVRMFVTRMIRTLTKQVAAA